MTNTDATRKQEADALRAKAEAARQSKRDSWERSDTDGFLSQWSSDISARMYDMQADLLERGSVETFYGLFDAQGRRLQARLVEGEWGLSWAVRTTSGRTLWIPHTLTFKERTEDDGRKTYYDPSFGPRTKAAKLGFTIGFEEAPAKIEIVGSGKGTGSLHTCRPKPIRTDGGYPADAVPYDG